MALAWSSDVLVVDGDGPAVEQLKRIGTATQKWVVIVRSGGSLRYAYSRSEVFERLSRSPVPYDPASPRSLADVLDLHEWQASRVVTASDKPGLGTAPARPPDAGPSGLRFVEVDGGGQVVAVGSIDVEAGPPPPGWSRAKPPAPTRDPGRPPQPMATRGPPVTDGPPATRGPPAPMPPTAAFRPPTPAAATRGPPPATVAEAPSAAPAAAPLPVDDEGTTPIRHASIEAVGELKVGAPVKLVIDLLRAPAPSTSGEALELGQQAADWETLALGVTVVSSAIDFDNHGRGKITIRRNEASIAAEFTGQLVDDVRADTEIEVHAQFWAFTRCCGSAVRRLVVGAADKAGSASAPPAAAQPSSAAAAVAPAGAAAAATPGGATAGSMRVEPDAEPPDLTVYITLLDPSSPGRMHWRMVTPTFDGLPPKLDGAIDLGQDPSAEAAAKFKQFANLERGHHRTQIEGFGDQLWERAPAEFRAVYWALSDHYPRALTIQFISDDPYLPWELMRPSRGDELHEPLALRHSVARWINRLNGYMRNRLSAGRLVTIAPKYKTVSTRLSLAETTAASLAASFGAEPVDGTWQAMNDLLVATDGKPVGMLYFTGHGLFNVDDAAASAIKLQDRQMTVAEVGRREVKLGERDGTLVFFNACEVGATGHVLGTVGGWADAFLSRRFRAFIAPLWAIDEEDAAQVTNELLERIITDRVPVATALRDLRAAHGDISPTFFSYLLYGDVTARLDAPA